MSVETVSKAGPLPPNSIAVNRHGQNIVIALSPDGDSGFTAGLTAWAEISVEDARSLVGMIEEMISRIEAGAAPQ